MQFTITINTKDLFFDVDAETHRYAKTLDPKNTVLVDNIASDSEETLDKHVLKRYADTADGEVRKILWQFLTRPAESVNSDNDSLSVIETSYTYVVDFSDRRSHQKLTSLTGAIHSFMVNNILTNFFISLHQDNGAKDYAAKSQLNRQDIDSILYKRDAPVYSVAEPPAGGTQMYAWSNSDSGLMIVYTDDATPTSSSDFYYSDWTGVDSNVSVSTIPSGKVVMLSISGTLKGFTRNSTYDRVKPS